MAWRYFAVRFNGDGTQTTIAHDLPLTGVSLTEELSGPGGLTADISPEIARLKADGRPVFETWSTAIFAEADGLIRGGGILVDMEPDGPKLSLDVLGVTGYADGTPYTGERSWTNADPLDLVRHMWAHIQEQEQGNLGLAVDELKSPVRIGRPDTLAFARAREVEEDRLARSQKAAAAYQATKAEETRRTIAVFRAAGLKTTTGRVIVQPTMPSGSSATTRNIWRDSNAAGTPTHTYNGKSWVNRGSLAAAEINAYQAAISAAAPAKAAADAAAKAAAEAKRAKDDIREQEGEPYVLHWFQTFDLGKEIDDLAKATPFDYRVQHSWDGEAVASQLVLAYPRMGRRRTDLRFVVGENVFENPPITYDGDEYANEVLMLGAGEGRSMVRASAHRRSNRLRRVAVVEDKSIQSTAAARARAQAEVRHRLGEADIETLSLIDHPNARLGSIDVGDDLLISTEAGWVDRADMWVRVLAITTEPSTNSVTLEVTRADKVI